MKINQFKKDLWLFAAALAAGFVIEALAHRAACAVDAWLAAADVDQEWWAMNHADAEEGA